jgi:hypothetical protein
MLESKGEELRVYGKNGLKTMLGPKGEESHADGENTD